MSKKIFDQKLYDNVGVHGELTIANYFKSMDNITDVCVFPFGKYGVDLKVTYSDGVVLFVECEVRENWSDGDFPYSSLHIPIRKLALKKVFPLVYVVLRKDLKRMMFIVEPFCKEYSIVNNPNKYVKDSEDFIDIPISSLNYTNL